MGRGDPDPLPPIEIVGAAPSAASLQRVSTGPGGPRRPGRRWVAVIAGVVLLLLGGLALGDDEGSPEGSDPKEARDNSMKLPPQTTTTRPRTTTTRPATTTTTRPVGPVFGTPVGGGLLVYGTSGWELVDLDTGARTEPELPNYAAYDAVAVRGGVVLRDAGSRGASFYGLTPDGVAEPVSLGPADQVVAAGRPDRVWLIDGGGQVGRDGGLANGTAIVRLVDLDGQALRTFDLAARYVSKGLPAGLVVERGGRVYLVDEAGVRPIAVGWTVGVSGDALVVLACDDEAVCEMQRRTADGARPAVLFEVPDPETAGFDSSTAVDGRTVLLTYGDPGDGGQVLHFLAADGGSLGSLPSSSGAGLNGVPRWLPGDHGLVAPGPMGMEWVHRQGAGWTSVDAPALKGLSTDLVLVIDW